MKKLLSTFFYVMLLMIFVSCQPETEEKKEDVPVEVTEITLDKSSLTLTPGKTETLTATILPSNADNKEVKWFSSDETVATVENGIVTGLAYGNATITASTSNKKTATCTVEIKEINWSESTNWTPVGDYETNFWDNASVYFVITDRFYNGNPDNDESYGREKAKSKNSQDDCGKFYGGDIAGLTKKLDYLKDLGINAIWLTAPYEQIHGFCIGGGGFFHYPYHGYYAMDYTNMDANMGTKEEFKTFVDTAHEKGIRVVMDVVMNHPGYNTLEDAKHLYPGILKDTFTDGVKITSANYHSFIDYDNCGTNGWDDWWGGKWIRAGLCEHYKTGSGDLKGSQASLPDFKTESDEPVSLPAFLKKKHTPEMAEFYPTEGYGVVALEEKDGFTVRDYLIYWLSNWVREFGIDGFRCDTAKHVEKDAWKALKDACVVAYNEWKVANPSDPMAVENLDFWMVGEHFGHKVEKSKYYTEGGFDSMINFSFRSAAGNAIKNPSEINSTYNNYAQLINSNANFNALSYISSHDTGSQDDKGLFYSDYSMNADKQKLAGSLLAMCPGGIQVYYGDEAGRKNSTFNLSGDKDQKNRSQMPWPETDELYSSEYSNGIYYKFDNEIYSHWAKMLKFRADHIAVATGSHKQMAKKPYAFARQKDDDKVIVILGLINGDVIVDVSSIGTAQVRDAYTGTVVTVSGGKATFTVTDANNGTLLIEAVN